MDESLISEVFESEKCREFLAELTNLCVRHAVCLSVSGYDALEVWDLNNGDANGALYCNGIEDKTKRKE